MHSGACHCGQVRWTFGVMPEGAIACNWTVCRRYGVRWAYDYEDGLVATTGETRAYVWGDRRIGFHFCPACRATPSACATSGPEGGRREPPMIHADACNAARARAARACTLGASGLGAAASGDAKVAGTPYHATGQLPCSAGGAGGAAGACEFGVIRGRPGHAEVHVTGPAGARRVLRVAGDQASAGDGTAVRALRSGDPWQVEVDGREQYRVPAAVISGG